MKSLDDNDSNIKEDVMDASLTTSTIFHGGFTFSKDFYSDDEQKVIGNNNDNNNNADI